MLSSVASAVMLYGMALIYGATGTTYLAEIAIAHPTNILLWQVGCVMIISGLAFKISAVPFHQWTPDVYQGAPTSVTAFMSVGTKTAALVAAFHVIPLTLGINLAVDAGARAACYQIVFVLSALSILIGNLAAISQTNIKRMMAYSGVAQGGYLLTAVFAGDPIAAKAMLFYLIVYAFMNIGVFVVLVDLEAEVGEVTLQSLRGLSSRHPALAAVMATCLVSLTGLPPTGGFLAKFNLFQVVLHAGGAYPSLSRMLVVIGILGSFMGACYYMRVVTALYSHVQDYQSRRWSFSSDNVGAAMALCVVGVLATGLFGQVVLNWLSSITGTF